MQMFNFASSQFLEEICGQVATPSKAPFGTTLSLSAFSPIPERVGKYIRCSHDTLIHEGRKCSKNNTS